MESSESCSISTGPWESLRATRPQRTLIAVGLMSGTSIDGIDAALVEFPCSSNDPPVRLRRFMELEIEPELRKRIQGAMRGGTASSAVDVVCQLNAELGYRFAEAARAVVEQAGLSLSQVDFIGSHGQTLYHIPRPDPARAWHVPSTLQVGDGAVIAEVTGVTTVADFRGGDMAAGGVGAPLIPWVDAFLFSDPGRDVICQNMGGIANCTLVSRSGAIVAFDSGPGNLVMDLLV